MCVYQSDCLRLNLYVRLQLWRWTDLQCGCEWDGVCLCIVSVQCNISHELRLHFRLLRHQLYTEMQLWSQSAVCQRDGCNRMPMLVHVVSTGGPGQLLRLQSAPGVRPILFFHVSSLVWQPWKQYDVLKRIPRTRLCVPIECVRDDNGQCYHWCFSVSVCKFPGLRCQLHIHL